MKAKVILGLAAVLIASPAIAAFTTVADDGVNKLAVELLSRDWQTVTYKQRLTGVWEDGTTRVDEIILGNCTLNTVQVQSFTSYIGRRKFKQGSGARYSRIVQYGSLEEMALKKVCGK